MHRFAVRTSRANCGEAGNRVNETGILCTAISCWDTSGEKVDLLGYAYWLLSWEKRNYKNTEMESGKNHLVLLMHLHQTLWEAMFQHSKTEHYFLIIIFRQVVHLQMSQTCLFTLAWRATCQRPGRTGKLAWYLASGQSVIWTWTRTLLCEEDPAWQNLTVVKHSSYN